VKTDASARQSEMNRAMPHELNTMCADETFPYVETRNAWQFSNSGRTSEGSAVPPLTPIPPTWEQSHQPAIGSVPWSRCGQRDRDHRMSRGPILRAARISSRFCRYSVSADFAESIALMRASSAISGRRLRVRFGHVVGGSEAGSGAYRICPPCGDLQSVISTLRSPTPSL